MSNVCGATYACLAGSLTQQGDLGLLDRQCTGHAVGDTRELGKDRITGGVGNASAMLGDPCGGKVPAAGQQSERSILVRPHQPTVFGDIGRQDRCQPPLDPFRHRRIPLRLVQACLKNLSALPPSSFFWVWGLRLFQPRMLSTESGNWHSECG
jgi:hypothetical protein